jgi:hypothetical protein
MTEIFHSTKSNSCNSNKFVTISVNLINSNSCNSNKFVIISVNNYESSNTTRFAGGLRG